MISESFPVKMLSINLPKFTSKEKSGAYSVYSYCRIASAERAFGLCLLDLCALVIQPRRNFSEPGLTNTVGRSYFSNNRFFVLFFVFSLLYTDYYAAHPPLSAIRELLEKKPNAAKFAYVCARIFTL